MQAAAQASAAPAVGLQAVSTSAATRGGSGSQWRARTTGTTGLGGGLVSPPNSPGRLFSTGGGTSDRRSVATGDRSLSSSLVSCTAAMSSGQSGTESGNGTASGGESTPYLGEEAARLIDSVETFIFDCDGVIWKGDSLIEGVPETLDLLRAKGKRLVFVTNNSTKSRKQYGKKFSSLGLNVSEDEIFSSSFAAAAYLQSINFNKKVYVIGEVGILDELDLAGIQHIGGPAEASKTIDLSPGVLIEHDHDVGAVVVGFDRYINYFKIQYATLCIRENPGCMFIATNRDAVTHLTDAQEWAGNGSMVGAIAGSTQREPHVVGKPSTFMMDWMSQRFNIDKSQICMVGDRLDTDILFGKAGGCRTLLVLSGVTTLETLESPENDIRPDFYADKLADLLRANLNLEEASTTISASP